MKDYSEFECELKPNPMAVMKYTVENLRAGMRLKEARVAAEERALKENKLHGASKLRCEMAQIMQELAEEEAKGDMRRKREDVEVADEEPSSSFTQIVAPGSRVTMLRKSKLAQEKRAE